MDESKTVWCGNLADQITEELLYELFLQAGPLERVKIPTDRDGRKSNFSFITFKHDISVNYATQLFNGTRLYGKTINIKPRSNPQQQNSNTSHQENQNRYQQIELNNMYIQDDNMQPKVYPLMSNNDCYAQEIITIQNLMQMGQQMMHNTNNFEDSRPPRQSDNRRRQSDNRRHNNYTDRRQNNEHGNRYNSAERHRQNFDNIHDSPNRNNRRRNDRDRSNSFNNRNNRRHDRY